MLPSRAVKLGLIRSNTYEPSTLLILKKQPFYIILTPPLLCKGNCFDALGRPIYKCDTARLYNKNHKSDDCTKSIIPPNYVNTRSSFYVLCTVKKGGGSVAVCFSVVHSSVFMYRSHNDNNVFVPDIVFSVGRNGFRPDSSQR